MNLCVQIKHIGRFAVGTIFFLMHQFHSSESSLIEFTDSTPKQQQADDEFDMFAQSRGTTFAESRVGGSTYLDNIEGVPNEGGIAGIMSAQGPYPKLPTPPPEQVCPLIFKKIFVVFRSIRILIRLGKQNLP